MSLQRAIRCTWPKGVLRVAPLALWGFCLLWSFSIGYFSRYSPVFMMFQLDSYDQIRALDFEKRMGAVSGQLSHLIASQVRFNDASKIPVERRRCFALMSMKRSVPYLNHSKAVIMLSFTLLNVNSRTSGIVSLAQALHASHAASASSIPHATVTVFVAGNAADNASHADHLSHLGVHLAKISDTFHVLADVNSTLHAAIVNEWLAFHCSCS